MDYACSVARKSIVAFNARLREETDRDALSDGLVDVARHHTAQAHPLVAASRDIFERGADGLATTYSPECVEGEFYELRVDGVLRSSPVEGSIPDAADAGGRLTPPSQGR